MDLAIGVTPGGAPPMLGALSRQWHAAVAAGHGREDISAARGYRRPFGTRQTAAPALATRRVAEGRLWGVTVAAAGGEPPGAVFATEPGRRCAISAAADRSAAIPAGR